MSCAVASVLVGSPHSHATFSFDSFYESQAPATEDSSQPQQVFIYMEDLEDIRQRDLNTLHVSYQHVFR